MSARDDVTVRRVAEAIGLAGPFGAPFDTYDANDQRGLMDMARAAIRALPLPLAPTPIATPADEAVARALRDIKAMSLGHHAHEDPAVLLHALLVEIPSACDEAIAALAAPSSESPADDAVARAREAFYEAARARYDLAQSHSDETRRRVLSNRDFARRLSDMERLEDERVWPAYDALLAAERAASDEKGG